MTIFYYTATGNSLCAAKKIGGKLVSIPAALKNNELDYKDDIIGIVYPCYAYGLPNSVKDFLVRVTWQAEYTFGLVTYGSIAGAATATLEQAAKDTGKQFDYINHLLMVDNFLTGFEMKKQLLNEPKKKIDQNLEQIKQDIQNRMKRKTRDGMPGFLAKGVAKMMSEKLANGDFGKNYIISDSCTKCKICTKVCPTGNIQVDRQVSFGNQCECCMACIHACPQNAIHLKNEKSSERFMNQNVTLAELISANEQGN